MLEYGWDEVAEVWVLEIPDQFARCEEDVIRKYVEDTPDSKWRLLKSVRLSAFFLENKRVPEALTSIVIPSRIWDPGGNVFFLTVTVVIPPVQNMTDQREDELYKDAIHHIIQ